LKKETRVKNQESGTFEETWTKVALDFKSTVFTLYLDSWLMIPDSIKQYRKKILTL